MKVGNTINGLTVTDVKRVNKLNLIQFLKEVDNYLQQGYQINVNSARQVGLVLMTDMFKTESASSVKVGSTDVGSTDVGSVGGDDSKEDTSVPEPQSVVTEPTAQSTHVEDTVESVEDGKEEVPVAAKKTTTRSKKTAQ